MNYRLEKEAIFKHIIHKLTDIIVFLLEVIKQKDKQQQPKYKLVDWEEKNKIGYCKVHLVGTSAVNDYTPEIIVSDDSFISGFSSLDIRTITNLANHEKYKPKATILAMNYEEGSVEVDFAQNGLTSVVIDPQVEEKLDLFSKKDVFRLGRAIGEHDVKV